MPEAEPDEEVFEVVDDGNNVIGRERRSVVHREGLIHRAVYCFVFNSAGELLIQQRSAKKKLGPLQWDLSVAEHLEPGESYKAGAERGLKEELGVDAKIPGERLKPTRFRELKAPEVGVVDREWVEAFELRGWDGPVTADAREVSDSRFVSLAELRRWAAESPAELTPWLLDEISSQEWFGAPAPAAAERAEPALVA